MIAVPDLYALRLFTPGAVAVENRQTGPRQRSLKRSAWETSTPALTAQTVSRRYAVEGARREDRERRYVEEIDRCTGGFLMKGKGFKQLDGIV